LLLMAAPALLAAPTPDRIYSFGEDGLENASHNQPVGSNNDAPLADEDTADSEGPTGAYLDLNVFNGPLYADVSMVGGGRPGAAPGTHGARFDGVDDYMTGIPLNRPDELALILATADVP